MVLAVHPRQGREPAYTYPPTDAPPGSKADAPPGSKADAEARRQTKTNVDSGILQHGEEEPCGNQGLRRDCQVRESNEAKHA